MVYKIIVVSLGILFFFSSSIGAEQPSAQEMIRISNQMMLAFMSKMQDGKLSEAREIALDMIKGYEKMYADDQKDYRSFHSAMEHKLYIMKQGSSFDEKNLIWVSQPISDGFYLLSILDFQEGRHDQALDNMQKAIHFNPMRSAFYSERGYMMIRKNTGPDFIMALVSYERALELADNPEDFAAALRGLAYVYLEQGRTRLALSCLLVAKEYQPSNLDTEEQLAIIRQQHPSMFLNTNLQIAREIMQESGLQITYSPKHIRVLLEIAEQYEQVGEKNRAKNLLERASVMAPNNIEVKRRLNSM